MAVAPTLSSNFCSAGDIGSPSSDTSSTPASQGSDASETEAGKASAKPSLMTLGSPACATGHHVASAPSPLALHSRDACPIPHTASPITAAHELLTEGGAQPTAASDVYALGVLLYELVYCRMPCASADGVQPKREDLVAARSMGQVPAFRVPCLAENEQMSPAMETAVTAMDSIIDLCLQLSPSSRPTAEAAARDIEKVVHRLLASCSS